MPMLNKKYRVKSTKTGHFVSDELSSWKATELCAKLTAMMNGLVIYEVIEFEDEKIKELNEASPEPREMDDDEIDGIRNLYKVSALYNDHKTFADDMYSRVQTNQKMITEKQAAYLWHLVFRYRRQISETRIVNIAEERKAY